MTVITALAYCVGGLSEADCLEAASQAAEAASRPLVFDWSEGPGDGVWDLDRTVVIHGDEATVRPGRVQLSGPMAEGLVIEARHARFEGMVHVRGGGSVILASRGTEVLVRVADADQTLFDGFNLRYAARDCLQASAVISADLGHVVARDCGSSAIAGHVSTLTVPWTAHSQEGSLGSAWQASALTFEAAPPLAVGDLVFVEDRPHVVVGLSGLEVRVFPWYEGEATSGDLVSAHGAGVRLVGTSTSGHRGSIDCQRTGSCLVAGGLYGGTWAMVAEAVGVGVVVGSSTDGAHRRGALAAHIENARRAGVKVQRSPASGLLITQLLQSPHVGCQWQGLSPVGSSAWRAWSGTTFLHDGSTIDGDLVWCQD